MTQEELDRLMALEKRIGEIAKEEGLNITPIDFKIVSANQVIEGVAYRFPVNFSHWSFGRDYDRTRTIYEHEHKGIPYEQVWNFDRPEAFLVETNPFILQVLVIAHVYGHVDFFLSNRYSQIGRMFSDVALQARNAVDRFRGYEQVYGVDVEKMMDAAFALEWNQHPEILLDDPDEESQRESLIQNLRSKIQKADGKLNSKETEEIEKQIQVLSMKTPPEPTYDLLGYITRHSPKPLRPWAQDVLMVIRDQARTLLPNMRTKILNEGWATYWHIRMMRRLFGEGLITPKEHELFNFYNSKITRESKESLNPYRLGLSLFEDLEDRWNKGRFGLEYTSCRDPQKRLNWDTQANLGRQKIFEVRSCFTDRMAIEALFSDDFIHQEKLYIYEERRTDDGVYYIIVEDNPEIIRQLLKHSHVFYGIPVISVEDGNYEGNGHLYLKHHSTGYELDTGYRDRTLEMIYYLWGRRVYLETTMNDRALLVSYDANRTKVIDYAYIK